MSDVIASSRRSRWPDIATRMGVLARSLAITGTIGGRSQDLYLRRGGKLK